ncbi:serine/threonine-protein kinase [Kitasatospora camelliae]|uniref:non-specific serine/threonine protein kinase n=1 Tax=Kitasatospora camelliae TaxID=3156397 RepID=A0AAU8KAI7_9ACTN
MKEGAQVGEDRLIAGRYRLLEGIGSGGMGTVWRARDELLGRDVAVKELKVRPELSPEETATLLERTRREARSAARISHRNVVVVHDVVQDEGLPCVVMEYVPSRTLGEVLKERGPLPAADAARIGREILAGLRAAHAAGVVHRDVKPGNVLLALDGRVVLTDFGIASVAGTSTLTRTGELVGSVDYLAPELVRGGTPSPASDLWALGVTLFQAVEGVPPFRRPTAIETAMAIATDPPAPALRAGPLTQLIASLLEKEPLGRPTAEVAEALLGDSATGQAKPADGLEDAYARGPEHAHGPGSHLAAGSGAAPARPEARPATGETSTVAQPSGSRLTPDAPTAGHLSDARAPGPADGHLPAVPGVLAAGHLPAVPAAAGPAVRSARRRAGLRWGVAVAVAVVVAGVLVLEPGLRPWRHRAQAGPVTSPAASSPAVPSATGTPSATVSSPAASGSAGPVVVPAGSSIRRDPAGFSLAVPDGWVRSTDAAGRVFYLSPDRAFRIGIHPTTPSGEGVLAELRKQDAAGPRTNPGYRGGSVQPTVFHGTTDAALWLWTWNGYPEDGFGARRVQDISWTEQGRSYDFWVSAPTGRLDEADHHFQVVSATFRIG